MFVRFPVKLALNQIFSKGGEIFLQSKVAESSLLVLHIFYACSYLLYLFLNPGCTQSRNKEVSR